MNRVLFYHPDGPDGGFSNFSRHGFLARVNDEVHWFPTNEHYFQYRKFANSDPVYAEKIRQANSPMQAAILGRSHDHPIDPDWDAKRDDVMMEGLRVKFKKHEHLAKLLLETGNAEIIEDSPRDSYWGRGKDWKGQNKLGKLLMQLRKELREGGK